MTLEEARQLMWSANTHDKPFIEYAKISQEPNGDYALVVEPVEGGQQVYRDARDAEKALLAFRKRKIKENERYFTLGKDDIPVECDRETHDADWPNREKTKRKIACSPEIEATIVFTGWARMIGMDGDVRLWNVSFTNPFYH